jgi:hypothetical protein
VRFSSIFFFLYLCYDVEVAISWSKIPADCCFTIWLSLRNLYL